MNVRHCDFCVCTNVFPLQKSSRVTTQRLGAEGARSSKRSRHLKGAIRFKQWLLYSSRFPYTKNFMDLEFFFWVFGLDNFE